MNSSSAEFTTVERKRGKKSKSKKQLYSDKLYSSCKESKTISTVKVSPEKDVTTISTVKVSPEKDMTTSLNVKITPKKNVITTTTIVKISPEKKVEYQKSERSTAVRNSLEKSKVKINSLEKYEVKKRRRLASVVDPMVFDRSFFASDEAFFIYKEKYALMVGSATTIMNEYKYCEIECRDVVTDLVKQNSDLTNLLNENALMKAKLSVRPYIEITQKEIVPYWLINKKYLTPYEKIFLSLKYRLTPAAAVMCKRLDELQLGPNYESKTSSSIVKTYHAFSKKVNHDDGEPQPFELSDEEWGVLFNDVGINDPVAKEIMKTVLNPITLDDLKKFGKIEKFFLVYANLLNIDLNESSELETTTQIKEWCSSFADKMTNFTYPLTKDNYTNEVYFQIGNINHADLEQLKTQLGTHGKAKFETSDEKYAVFYRTYETS